MDIYNAEKTYKQGETCLYEGIVYRASCGNAAMIGIAPIEDSIGSFWIEDEDDIADAIPCDVEPESDFNFSKQGVVDGLNP